MVRFWVIWTFWSLWYGWRLMVRYENMDILVTVHYINNCVILHKSWFIYVTNKVIYCYQQWLEASIRWEENVPFAAVLIDGTILQFIKCHHKDEFALVTTFLCQKKWYHIYIYPDSEVHVGNMGSTWGRQDPGEPHVGPVNLVIWVILFPQQSNIIHVMCWCI